MPRDSVQERAIPAAGKRFLRYPRCRPASLSRRGSEAEMRGRWGAVPDFAVRPIRAPSFRGAAAANPE